MFSVVCINTSVSENGMGCGYADSGIRQWVTGKDEYSLQRFCFFRIQICIVNRNFLNWSVRHTEVFVHLAKCSFKMYYASEVAP